MTKYEGTKGLGTEISSSACSHVVATTVIATLALLGLSSCAKKDDANKTNFTQALTAGLGDAKLCTGVSQMTPAEANVFFTTIAKINAEQAAIISRARTEFASGKGKLLESPVVDQSDKNQTSERVHVLHALAKGGFLHGNGVYSFNALGLFSVPQVVAMLNEKGLAHLVEETVNDGFQTRRVSRICYGKLSIDQVLRFTAPADLMGKRVSQVQYRVKASDMPEWAESMSVHFDPDKELTALMVLTSEGWVVEKSTMKF